VVAGTSYRTAVFVFKLKKKMRKSLSERFFSKKRFKSQKSNKKGKRFHFFLVSPSPGKVIANGLKISSHYSEVNALN